MRPCGHAAMRPCGHAAMRPCGHAAIRPCGHPAMAAFEKDYCTWPHGRWATPNIRSKTVVIISMHSCKELAVTFTVPSSANFIFLILLVADFRLIVSRLEKRSNTKILNRTEWVRVQSLVASQTPGTALTPQRYHLC